MLDFPAGGSQSVALAAIVSETGRQRVLSSRRRPRGHVWGPLPLNCLSGALSALLPAFGGSSRSRSLLTAWRKILEDPRAVACACPWLWHSVFLPLEMRWPPLQSASSSSSLSLSGPASTSRSVSQGESEDGASSESVTRMPL